MPAAAAVAVVGSVAAGAIGANAQAKAAKQAANAQVKAADQATALQKEIYYDQRKLLTPGALEGAQAEAKRMLMTGSTPEEANKYLTDTYTAYGAGTAPTIGDWNASDWLHSTPGYEFNFNEGQRALERSKAAGGDYFSGDTARAITRFGQDYANNEWGDLWGQLGEQAGVGRENTGTVVNVAGQYGNSAAANTMAAGIARASGYRDAGAAWGDFWGNTGPGGIGAVYGNGAKQGWW